MTIENEFGLMTEGKKNNRKLTAVSRRHPRVAPGELFPPFHSTN